MRSWRHAIEIQQPTDFLVKLHRSEWISGRMAGRQPVTNVTTAFSSSSEPPAVRGQSDSLCVGFCFFKEWPWQCIMILERYDRKPEVVTADLDITLFCEPVCAIEHFMSKFNVFFLQELRNFIFCWPCIIMYHNSVTTFTFTNTLLLLQRCD
jgi:hypothetical protein